MAAGDHYSSTATSNTMDGLPSTQPLPPPSPLGFSDYAFFYEAPVSATAGHVDSSSSSSCGSGSSTRSGASERRSREGGPWVAFRTKSEVEIMDDGFKWRKYGKKSVKNSPSPRNYYRCSTEGCSVKKRVERDPNDPSYVITAYDGTHNHASPDVVYYATQDSESGRFVVSGYHHITRSS